MHNESDKKRNDTLDMKIWHENKSYSIHTGVDLSPAEPAILDAITQSRWWQSLYLRLDRVILQFQRISASMSQEAEPGQMAFDFKNAA